MFQPNYAPHVEVYRIHLTGHVDTMGAARYARHLIAEGAAPGEDVLEIWLDNRLVRVGLLERIATRGVVWEAPHEAPE